jgi:glutathione S-transferase
MLTRLTRRARHTTSFLAASWLVVASLLSWRVAQRDMRATGGAAAPAHGCDAGTPQRRRVARSAARADSSSASSSSSSSSAGVTFYTNKLCPYAQRVAIALHAKGVAHETVTIDLRNKPNWYKALVPSGKVPALRVGAEAPRAESLQLLRYVEATFPGPPLLPGAPGSPERDAAAEEAEALFALCDDTWVRAGYTVLSDGASPPHALAAAFDAVAAPVEAALARHASAGPFLLGERFSLADAAFAPFTERYALAFRELRGWDMLAARPALAKWHAAVEATPAFAASRAPQSELLELYRMFLKADYFNKAGVTTPAAQAAAAAKEQSAREESGGGDGASRRSLLSLPLLFLPVRGCSVPGATDTRVPAGVACTPLWQPAGGAEARAVARLRGEQATQQDDTQQQQQQQPARE